MALILGECWQEPFWGLGSKSSSRNLEGWMELGASRGLPATGLTVVRRRAV